MTDDDLDACASDGMGRYYSRCRWKRRDAWHDEDDDDDEDEDEDDDDEWQHDAATS